MIGSKIYWVYCDFSLLEAPWSILLAMLDLFICILIVQTSQSPTPSDQTLSIIEFIEEWYIPPTRARESLGLPSPRDFPRAKPEGKSNPGSPELLWDVYHSL